ncbi:hypothetical protein [Laspinema olomoucense]|uniref:Uncharacterized protein n=1 Tax=Laspinema olomoucense D3b TaxID=2953688 RepID=A0ABT2NEP6_9CYAN|nr:MULTISPECIES: hypothetical protein [unclassified Laspinema]MCT7981178.1 hypothetical protein [Laspinema sp. D3b]MCT7988226.1 hypothetical protein [Laspinema sp. D3a]MCT7994676.1 hypothetical protein [Laspinema sp. D3c]
MNREPLQRDRSKPMTHYPELSSVLTPLTLFQGRVGLGSRNHEGYGWGKTRLFL